MINPPAHRVIFALAATIASLAASGVQAQAVQADSPASSTQTWNPSDAPRPWARHGIDAETRAQIDQSARIQERIRQMARPMDGISNRQDEAFLRGDYGQSAKFGAAWRLHRWGTVLGMSAGYLIWTGLGLAVLSILDRMTRPRRGGR